MAPSSPGTIGRDDNQRAIAIVDPVSTVRNPSQNLPLSDVGNKFSGAEISPRDQPVLVVAPQRQIHDPACQSDPTEVAGSIAEEPTHTTPAQRAIYPSELLARADPILEIPPLPSSVILPIESRQNSPQVNASMGEHSRNQPSVSDWSSTHARNHEDIIGSPLQSPSFIQPGVQRSSVQGNRAELLTPNLSPSFSSRVPMALAMPEARPYFNNNGAPPHKRQRTQQASMPSLQPQIALIQSHIASTGGFSNLEHDLERPRFQLLERACQDEDSFYVALHQLFCMWDFDRNVFASITGYPDINTLNIAFGHISQLIRDNGPLNMTHKKWFAEFPSPLLDLLRTSTPYSRIVAGVGNFLQQLATDWDTMSRECITRRYPPLVDELVGRLGLLSPILQGVFFRATIRNLKVTEGEFQNRMEQLFKQDQLGHQSLAARYNTDRPPGNKEIQDRSEKLKNNYLKIHDQFVKMLRGNAMLALASSPLTSASLTPGTQSQLQPRRTPSQPQLAQANMGDTMHWNQFSPTLQTQQLPLRRDSNNPAIPQNVVAQRSQHNTPSPILAQGPTMSSHIQPGFQVRRNDTPVHLAQQQQQYQQQYPQQQNQQPNQAQYAQYNNNVYTQYPPQNGANYSPQIGAVQQGQSNVIPSQILPSMSPEQYQNWVNQQRGQMQWAQVPLQQIPMNIAHQQSVQNQQGTAQQQGISQQQVQAQQDHLQRVKMQQQMQMQRHQHQLSQQQRQQILNQGVTALDQSSLRRTNGVPSRDHSRTNSINSGSGLPSNTTTSYGPPGQLPYVAQRNNSRPSHQPMTPMQMDIVTYSRTPVLERPLVPPAGYRHPNPALEAGWSAPPSALHQAHLRSPYLVPSDLAKHYPPRRYYQVVKGFALEPTKLTISVAPLQFQFEAIDLDLRSVEYVPGPGQVLTREFQHGSLQYRLRCVQMKKGESACSISQWVVQDTIWPDSTCPSITSGENRTHLDIRRKVQHGKDLPIDITSLMSPAGNNLIISTSRTRPDWNKFSYFVAVEIVEILEHTAIMDMCLSNHIPANVTLDSIKKSLAGPEDDDDDFAMAVSDLAINLADPFTAQIFTTPVRGSACLHRECFDLETFLKTRQSKAKRPDQPCMVDVWKCPLCNADARPYGLRVDDFLAEVRKELEERGMLDVSAIWIAPDGKWRPKVEEKTGVSSDESSDDGGAGARKQSRASSKGRRVVEVISLDDDDD